LISTQKAPARMPIASRGRKSREFPCIAEHIGILHPDRHDHRSGSGRRTALTHWRLDCSARQSDAFADTRSPSEVPWLVVRARHRRRRSSGLPLVRSRAERLSPQHRGLPVPGAEPPFLRGRDHGRRPRRRRQCHRRRVPVSDARLSRERERHPGAVRGGSHRRILREGPLAAPAKRSRRHGGERRRGRVAALRRPREPRAGGSPRDRAGDERPLRRRPRSRARRDVSRRVPEGSHGLHGQRHHVRGRQRRLHEQAAAQV